MTTQRNSKIDEALAAMPEEDRDKVVKGLAGMPEERRAEVEALVLEQRATGRSARRPVGKKGHVSLDAERESEAGASLKLHDTIDAATAATRLGDQQTKKPRRRVDQIPVGIRPAKLVDGRLGVVLQRKLNGGKGDRAGDKLLLAAARRLKKDLDAFVAGDLVAGGAAGKMRVVKESDGNRRIVRERNSKPRVRHLATDELRAAILDAHLQAYGVRVEETWRELLLNGREGYLVMAKCAAANLHLQRIDRLPMWATPAGMHRRVRAECKLLGVPGPPAWLDRDALAWLIARFNPGGGGGKSKKLGDAAVRELLADEQLFLSTMLTDVKRAARGADLDKDGRRKVDTKNKFLRRRIAKTAGDRKA